MKRKIGIGLVVVTFLVGVCIMSYPLVSSVINNMSLRQGATAYTEAVEKMDESDYSDFFKEAEAYNKSLTSKAIITDPFDINAYKSIGANYQKTLDIDGNGLICYVKIPKIDVELPVYHGTSKGILSKGAGHLMNTSMPIGGKSTHAVISAHTGYPTQTFFDYLTDLEVGDTFYIRVLNKTLQYEVDQIKVVLPENTNDLRIIQGEDHVTLLTCTPYGINSHRLLVRGKRVPYVENSENSSSGYQSSGDNGFFFMGYKIPYWVAACVVAGFVLVVVIIVIAVLKKRKKQEKPERKTKGNEKE